MLIFTFDTLSCVGVPLLYSIPSPFAVQKKSPRGARVTQSGLTINYKLVLFSFIAGSCSCHLWPTGLSRAKLDTIPKHHTSLYTNGPRASNKPAKHAAVSACASSK